MKLPILQKTSIINQGIFYLLFTIYYSLFGAGCQKEKIQFEFTEMTSGITRDLNSIFFMNDSIGYACGGARYEKGDILKTTDGGFTWVDQSSEEMIKALYNITFLNADTGFSCGFDGKIFRTSDGGNHWQYIQASYWRPIRDLFILNGETVFACGGDGFKFGYRLQSADGGTSWNVDTTIVEYRSVHFFDDSVGVLAGYGVLLRTTDGGKTWNYTNGDGDFFVSMCFVNDQVGYAVGYTGSIMKSSDGGISWERLRNANSILESALYFNGIIFRDESTGYVIGERGCLLKTEDGGDHWEKVENVPDIDLFGIALFGNGGVVCGEGGKIFRFIE